MAICWALAGNALDQWDAKTSARVNLRRGPDLHGEILRILPQGHSVQILEQQDLWCRVAVEGEFDFQGWVYAEYLEKMAPDALNTEPLAQAVKVEAAPGESIPGTQPIEAPPESGIQPEPIQPQRAPVPEQTLTSGFSVQSPVQAELQKAENESNAQQLFEFLLAVEPVHVNPDPSPDTELKPDAPKVNANDSPAPPKPAVATPFQKRIPGADKQDVGAKRETVPTVSRQPLPGAHGMAFAALRSSDFQEAKAPESGRRLIGPIEIALKLLSILLYGLVALMLYKGY
jgi:hypothetical protein